MFTRDLKRKKDASIPKNLKNIFPKFQLFIIILLFILLFYYFVNNNKLNRFFLQKFATKNFVQNVKNYVSCKHLLIYTNNDLAKNFPDCLIIKTNILF